MIVKLIASGVAGAAAVAGTGYTFITSQNAKIESQAREMVTIEAKLEASDAALKSKNALIDHVMQELRESRQ